MNSCILPTSSQPFKLSDKNYGIKRELEIRQVFPMLALRVFSPRAIGGTGCGEVGGGLGVVEDPQEALSAWALLCRLDELTPSDESSGERFRDGLLELLLRHPAIGSLLST
jgi:hypothetical protein